MDVRTLSMAVSVPPEAVAHDRRVGGYDGGQMPPVSHRNSPMTAERRKNHQLVKVRVCSTTGSASEAMNCRHPAIQSVPATGMVIPPSPTAVRDRKPARCPMPRKMSRAAPGDSLWRYCTTGPASSCRRAAAACDALERSPSRYPRGRSARFLLWGEKPRP